MKVKLKVKNLKEFVIPKIEVAPGVEAYLIVRRDKPAECPDHCFEQLKKYVDAGLIEIVFDIQKKDDEVKDIIGRRNVDESGAGGKKKKKKSNRAKE